MVKIAVIHNRNDPYTRFTVVTIAVIHSKKSLHQVKCGKYSCYSYQKQSLQQVCYGNNSPYTMFTVVTTGEGVAQ